MEKVESNQEKKCVRVRHTDKRADREAGRQRGRQTQTHELTRTHTHARTHTRTHTHTHTHANVHTHTHTHTHERTQPYTEGLTANEIDLCKVTKPEQVLDACILKEPKVLDVVDVLKRVHVAPLHLLNVPARVGLCQLFRHKAGRLVVLAACSIGDVVAVMAPRNRSAGHAHRGGATAAGSRFCSRPRHHRHGSRQHHCQSQAIRK